MDDFSAHVHQSQHVENKEVHLPEWEDPAADGRKQAERGADPEPSVSKHVLIVFDEQVEEIWPQAQEKGSSVLWGFFPSFMASNSGGRTGPESRKRAE